MALKPCQGCGKQVDETAKACPGCGRPHPTMKSPPWWSYVVAFGMLATISWCIVSPSKPKSSDSDRPPTREYTTVTIPELAAMGGKKNGAKLCTCGFVVGTTSATANTVYLSEKNEKNWKKHGATVLCAGPNFGEKNSFSLPEQRPACVRGVLSAPMLAECSVVDSCLW